MSDAEASLSHVPARNRIEVGSAAAVQVGDNSTQNNYFNGQTRLPSSTVAVPIIPLPEAPVKVFVGRSDEVRTLLGLLNPVEQKAGAVVVSAVAGLAGVGKTALAWHAAATAVNEGWFPGGAVMVDLHGYDPDRRIEPIQVFGPVLRALGVNTVHIPLEPDQHAAAFHQILVDLANQDRPVLLVLDNASSQSQIADLIPVHRAHRVLITSRHTFGDLVGARLLELDVLTVDEAVALLDQALRNRDARDRRSLEQSKEAAELARLCGTLPLALHIVAALLADDSHRVLGDLAAELEDAKSRLDGLAYDERAVRAAFDLSWWHLIDHDQLAARLFRLLSINPGPDISIAAAAAAAGQRSVPTGRQLRTLRRAHLVEPAISTDRWRMHDLVSLYSMSLGEECAEDDDRESAQLRLVQYYSETANSAGGWINSLPSDKALGLFLNRGSGLKWLAAEQANLVASVRMAHAMNEYDVAIDLSCSIAPYLEAQRNLSDSLLVSEVALESARAMNIPVREAGVLNNIGIALTSMRRYKEAIRYLNKAVAKAKESGDGIEEATALTSLAGALRQYFGPHLGIEELQRAIQIGFSLGDSRAAAFAMTNLGIALREVGDFHKAEHLLRSALAIHAESGARRAEAQTLVQLATTLGQMNDSESSIALFREALGAYRDVGDRNGEGQTMMNLGNVLRQDGDLLGALENYYAAIRISRDTKDPHALALAQNNAGTLLEQLGQTHESEELLKAAKTALSTLRDN